MLTGLCFCPYCGEPTLRGLGTFRHRISGGASMTVERYQCHRHDCRRKMDIRVIL